MFIAEESRDWFAGTLRVGLRDDRTMVLDGDLPGADWLTEDWAPKLSDSDGELHAVPAGRVRIPERPAELARAGVHLHLHSKRHARWSEHWRGEGGHLHVHDAVEPANWVAELSRYDAAWMHSFRSRNGGAVLSAEWDDLDIPARASTYAYAGLPWILRDNAGHRVTVDRIAAELGFGVPYRAVEDLAAGLRAEVSTRAGQRAARAARAGFSFDQHVDRLVALFSRVAAGEPAALR